MIYLVFTLCSLPARTPRSEAWSLAELDGTSQEAHPVVPILEFECIQDRCIDCSLM